MDYNLSTTWTVAFILLALWELVWKGFALWKASHNNQSGWFIALLVLNTAGILPIIYLLTHRSHPSDKKKEAYYEKALPING
jgi:hypothetical protein